MSLERTPFVSRVVRVTRGSESLRVTIPQVVASTMGLRPGDQVAWSLESSSPVVRVRRLPGGSGDPAPEAER